MTDHQHDPLSARSLFAGVIVGLFVTIVGGLTLYSLTRERLQSKDTSVGQQHHTETLAPNESANSLPPAAQTTTLKDPTTAKPASIQSSTSPAQAERVQTEPGGFSRPQASPIQTNAPPTQPLSVRIGDIAPDFTLLEYDGQRVRPVSLHDFRGRKNVALAFFVFAFTGGWTREMQAFQANIARLEGADTQVLGVSVDSAFTNHAFAVQNGLTFPLLGDMGANVIKAYGLAKEYHIGSMPFVSARRATFLIDKTGRVVEEQPDAAAIDPTRIVDACELRRSQE